MRGQCLLLAQSGHAGRGNECLLLGVKRTSSDMPECPLLTQSGHPIEEIAAAQNDWRELSEK